MVFSWLHLSSINIYCYWLWRYVRSYHTSVCPIEICINVIFARVRRVFVRIYATTRWRPCLEHAYEMLVRLAVSRFPRLLFPISKSTAYFFRCYLLPPLLFTSFQGRRRFLRPIGWRWLRYPTAGQRAGVSASSVRIAVEFRVLDVSEIKLRDYSALYYCSYHGGYIYCSRWKVTGTSLFVTYNKKTKIWILIEVVI